MIYYSPSSDLAGSDGQNAAGPGHEGTERCHDPDTLDFGHRGRPLRRPPRPAGGHGVLPRNSYGSGHRHHPVAGLVRGGLAGGAGRRGRAVADDHRDRRRRVDPIHGTLIELEKPIEPHRRRSRARLKATPVNRHRRPKPSIPVVPATSTPTISSDTGPKIFDLGHTRTAATSICRQPIRRRRQSWSSRNSIRVSRAPSSPTIPRANSGASWRAAFRVRVLIGTDGRVKAVELVQHRQSRILRGDAAAGAREMALQARYARRRGRRKLEGDDGTLPDPQRLRPRIMGSPDGRFDTARPFLSLDRMPRISPKAPGYRGRRTRAALYVFHYKQSGPWSRRMGRSGGRCVNISRNRAMAKPTTVQIKLVSTRRVRAFSL